MSHSQEYLHGEREGLVSLLQSAISAPKNNANMRGPMIMCFQYTYLLPSFKSAMAIRIRFLRNINISIMTTSTMQSSITESKKIKFIDRYQTRTLPLSSGWFQGCTSQVVPCLNLARISKVLGKHNASQNVCPCPDYICVLCLIIHI